MQEHEAIRALFELREQVSRRAIDRQKGWDRLHMIDGEISVESEIFDAARTSIEVGIGTRTTLLSCISRRIEALEAVRSGRAAIGVPQQRVKSITSRNVMICYRATGEGPNIAAEAHHYLTEKFDCNVFFDRRETSAGEDKHVKYYEKARDDLSLVVICTPELRDCSFCLREIAHAASVNNPIIPVTTQRDCSNAKLTWLGKLTPLRWTEPNSEGFWKTVFDSLGTPLDPKSRVKAIHFLFALRSEQEQIEILRRLLWTNLLPTNKRKAFESHSIVEYIENDPEKIEELVAALGPR